VTTSVPPPGTTIADAATVEVADGIYAYVQPDGTWWINNTGFLVGRSGVISVDACATQARTEAYLAAVRGVTSRPVRLLINTHHHGDHTFGNYLFEGATIVAHDRVRAEMLGFGLPGALPFWDPVEWGDVQLSLPFLTYTTQVTVYSDELRCELRHVGTPAHTTNDSVLWIPEHSLLFSGDLVFNGGTPFLLMGSIAGAIEAVQGLKALAPATIVPGHGGVCGPEVIDTVLDYLGFVQRTAEAARGAGLSPLDAAREVDLGAFAELLDAERIVGNLHRAYAELDGAERGAPIDLISALTDMVTFNGGRPLNCHA
jgi:cyclase